MTRFLSGHTVLVVEDEMLVMMMIEDMLADLGCEAITTAATVDQALHHIDTMTLDVAMLDMNLGGSSSERVADALASHQVPFIYSTGNTGREATEGHRDRPVLRKPFKAETLEELLRGALAGQGEATR
jgi:DNA-binding NtrC family response regulator